MSAIQPNSLVASKSYYEGPSFVQRDDELTFDRLKLISFVVEHITDFSMLNIILNVTPREQHDIKQEFRDQHSKQDAAYVNLWIDKHANQIFTKLEAALRHSLVRKAGASNLLNSQLKNNGFDKTNESEPVHDGEHIGRTVEDCLKEDLEKANKENADLRSQVRQIQIQLTDKDSRIKILEQAARTNSFSSHYAQHQTNNIHTTHSAGAYQSRTAALLKLTRFLTHNADKIEWASFALAVGLKQSEIRIIEIDNRTVSGQVQDAVGKILDRGDTINYEEAISKSANKGDSDFLIEAFRDS